MKYLVKAKLKASLKNDLMREINADTLGSGSVAFGEYIKNMQQARVLEDGTLCWLEICFCSTPLAEELPYWQRYFEEITIENAHNPNNCQDYNGNAKRACFECSCTDQLEQTMLRWGEPFIA
ncbi:hypothetical protein [Halioxenophilus sp. WMMB6]|uniref:hypothetical protein n=1 Tax=Halioxenophilus sp. WMMB6 TaxID=3073815 RepID=UPI00295EDBAA|nr:hypothetical protein [Halioxenophilus sp. WMMB6]